MIILQLTSQPELRVAISEERALARLTGQPLPAPGKTSYPLTTDLWQDLECDAAEARRARITGHRGVRVTARSLGLDDDSLIALFILQDHALAGEPIACIRSTVA